ncbi:MAG: hypothetical protein HYV02_03030 [Deltaproteobacteria bacterium]|nr:hypothetical protein [Deltaproteobacteria bacterium]
MGPPRRSPPPPLTTLTAFDFTTPQLTLTLDPQWLVDDTYYSVCIQLKDSDKSTLQQTMKATKKWSLLLTADHPLLLDGLQLTVPAGTSLAAPLLTVNSPFPVVLRNVRLTGNGKCLSSQH